MLVEVETVITVAVPVATHCATIVARSDVILIVALVLDTTLYAIIAFQCFKDRQEWSLGTIIKRVDYFIRTPDVDRSHTHAGGGFHTVDTRTSTPHLSLYHNSESFRSNSLHVMMSLISGLTFDTLPG